MAKRCSDSYDGGGKRHKSGGSVSSSGTEDQEDSTSGLNAQLSKVRLCDVRGAAGAGDEGDGWVCRKRADARAALDGCDLRCSSSSSPAYCEEQTRRMTSSQTPMDCGPGLQEWPKA